MIGPYSSFCGQVGIPIMNRAPGGPLAVVSPIATHPGLTCGGPVAERRGEPEVYYPTGVRNFARVMARDDLQGVANALLARELGLERVFVLYDRSEESRRPEQANPFLRTARQLGIRIAGTRGFSPEPGSKDRLAGKVARSGAEGVFIAGVGSEGGAGVLKALRARLGSRIKIMTGDPFIPIPMLLEAAGPAARGLYVSATDVPPDAPGESAAGRRFARDYGTLRTPVMGVLPAAQATDIVLDAIARSDGTRESVLEELRGAEVRNGILGDFSLDRHGDIKPARLAIFRVPRTTPPGSAVF